MRIDSIAGIDYGSKMAGTTVLAWASKRRLNLAQSAKNEDADAFITTRLAELSLSVVFIDAPLSLPSVYRTGSGDDYFYRSGDRELKAMSPMFLGGLTARAMRLASECQPIQFVETYPAATVARVLMAPPAYKSDLDEFSKLLRTALRKQCKLDCPVHENWHQVDATLAWFSGWRHLSGESLSFGHSDEGLIIL